MLRRSQVRKRQRKLLRTFDRAGRSLVSGKTTISEFQRTIAFNLKREVTAITKAVAGNNATQRHYGLSGSSLRRMYARLDKFGIQIHRGELTEKQILHRARQYSKGLFQWYNEVQIFHNANSKNHNEAMRRLDPASDHCSACPGHSTRGQYVPIDQIVPVGTACPCGGNCKCSVVTRFNPNLVEVGRNPGRRFANAQQKRVSSEPNLDDVLRILTGRRRTRFARGRSGG